MGFLTTTDVNKSQLRLAMTDQAKTDLMLDAYLDRIFEAHKGSKSLSWASYMTQDIDDLMYRREVLKELESDPHLVSLIDNVCKTISQIHQLQEMPSSGEFYAESIREFSVLSLSFNTMSRLSDYLKEKKARGELTSRGLTRLSEVISEKVAVNFTKDFDQVWQQYAGGLDQLGSFRFRFTLDKELNIQGASLEAIQKEKYVKNSLTSHVLKENRQSEKPWDLMPLKDIKTPTEELVRVQLGNNQKQFAASMARITDDLDDLYQDLSFYLGALLYMKQMAKTKTPTCFAELRPMSEKAFSVKEMYNPVLTVFMRGGTIPNDITFKEGGEILVLTGINQGGKTTFLRSVGVTQAICQLGWPVACREAVISPVDKIVTVFSHEENTNLQHGKLGQELKTIREGLDIVTSDSLLLCNEPITGTSPMENLFLSREVLSACKLQNYKGIWVTHIYDLASGADTMNQELTGSLISSIIAVANGTGSDVSASYHIERGQPQFTSYAKEVLHKETGVF